MIQTQRSAHRATHPATRNVAAPSDARPVGVTPRLDLAACVREGTGCLAGVLVRPGSGVGGCALRLRGHLPAWLRRSTGRRLPPAGQVRGAAVPIEVWCNGSAAIL